MINRLFLLTGSDYKIRDGLTIKHPKLRDIVQLGNGVICEDIYWLFLSIVVSDPYENMVWLNDQGIDYEKTTPFYVFCMKWLDTKQKMISGNADEKNDASFSNFLTKSALSFYFGDHDYDLDIKQKNFIIRDKSNDDWYITSSDFELAHQFICQVNRIDESRKIKPATESAKKILIEDMRDEQKRRMKRKKRGKKEEQLAECVASILYSGCVSSLSAALDCGIYLILSGGSAINKKMRVDSLLHGVYSGTVKTESISSEDLSWIN